MNKQLLTVFKKEMRDMVRDRRALFAAFSFAFLGPVLFVFLSMILEDEETPYDKSKIQVQGADYAPGLVRALENADLDLELVEPTEAPKELSSELAAIVVIAPNFQYDLARGEAGSVIVYVSGSSPKRMGQAERVSSIIDGYGQQIAAARLNARGVPFSLLSPIEKQVADLAEESFASQYFGGMMTLIFIMAPFVASMSVAIDTLAGERERNSLQPLLAQPVSGRTLVIGKWMMVSTFGLVGTLLACVTYFITLEFLGSEAFQVTMHISPFNFLMTLLLLLPLAMFVASAQMYVSIQVKSFKEGQTYVSLLTMLPTVIGYVRMGAGDKLPPWIDYLPVFSHFTSLGDLLFKNEVAMAATLISLSVSLIGTLVLLILTGRLVDHERLLDAN